MQDSNYTTAIILNNQGTQHLESGHFVKAARSFHLALDTINAAMEVDHASDDNMDDDEAMHSAKNNTTVTFEWSIEARYPEHEDTEETFVYRRGLIIHHTPPLTTPTDESAAITYNLGLAYHLYGLEQNSQFLQTALAFYEFALEVAETKRHDFFDVAVLNNLGQIHHELFDFDKSMQCFVHVFQQLQSMSQPMAVCDYMGFMLNLSLEAPIGARSA